MLTKQAQFKNTLGVSAVLAGIIASTAPTHVRAVDFTAAEFSAQISAPRPVLSAQPAAYLFADVNFAEEAPEAPASRSTGGGSSTPRRTSSHRSSSTSTSSYSAKSGKSAKDIVPLRDDVMMKSGPTFAFTGGWDSLYWYKGLDQVKNATSTSNNESSGVWFGRASMEWDGFALYAGYLQSDEKLRPRVNAVDLSVPEFRKENYGETQVGASYTLGVVQKALDLTVGYNAIFFNDSGFWGHKFQGESFAKLSYTQIPFLTPSISASYMNSDSGKGGIGADPAIGLFRSGSINLTGWWYEARLDGHVTLFSSGDFAMVFNPFIVLGVDGGYNNPSNTFKPYTVEYGVNLPTRLTKNLTLTLHVNGATAIIDGYDAPEFWGGASVTYKF